MSISGVLLGVGLVAALQGSITSALKLSSPCPSLFHYDSADREAGQWSGTVTLLSDYELHGVWVRLIFDEKLTELDVHDNFAEVVPSDDKKEFLIKNRNFLLAAGVPTDFKITVKFESDKFASLDGYRLNAKMVCSSNKKSFGQSFPGDLNNKDFLASITSQHETSAYKEFEGCGTAPLLANREPANKKAQNGQWPWQGAIYIQNNNEEYVCGATLISSRHVITPAHCITYQKSEFALPVGQVKVSLGKSHDDKNAQELEVEKIFLHPGYRARQLLNDLSIIQLVKPVIIGDYVRPICLKQLVNKMEGFLVGYGINGDKIEDLTDARVDIVNEEQCLQKNSNLRSLLTDNVACGRYIEDNVPCVGDSGSSFISVRDGPKPVWELKGIVTVGTALQNKYVCDSSSSVLFVNVANYLKWIQEHVA